MTTLQTEQAPSATDQVEEAESAVPAGPLAVLTFSCGTETYGVPLAEVHAVTKVGVLVPFPDLPAALLGVVNLHGQVMPVVDLRGLLNLGVGCPSINSRLIVVSHGTERAGLLVDGVGDIAHVPAPDGAAGSSEMLRGKTVLPDGRLINLLDVALALAALAAV
jgi:purine-binding chemotaxis protein CheW